MSQLASFELLFIDTFSHASAEDVNLDLVQFSKVVTVDEVRIVPNGTKVTIPNSSIGTINGSTLPQTFTLELYVNNKASNDCTFQRIGLIDFKENTEAYIKVENNAPTDVLIIKGWYQNVTLAVYGCVSHSDSVHLYNYDTYLDVPIKNKVKEYSGNDENSHVLHSSIINSSSSQELVNKYPASQKNSFLASQQEALDSNPKSIPLEHVGMTKDPREINAEKTSGDADGGEIEDDEDRKESFQNLYFDDENDMAEAEPTDELTDIYGTLSDGEIPENDLDMTQVVPEDSNLPFNPLMPSESGEIGEDWDDEGSWMLNSLSSFNPCNLQISPFVTFTDPSLNEYEVEKMKISASSIEEEDEIVERNMSQILDTFMEFKKHKEIEKKFDTMASMATLLTQASLAHLNHRKRNVTSAMIDWVVEYWDFDKLISACDASCAIRNLKVIVRLCGMFCASDEDLATSIISRGVQHSLIDLLSDQHLPPSIRILTLASLHSSILTSAGLKSFLELSINSYTPYQRFVKLLSTAKKDRCWKSMARLMNKIHCYELLSLLKQLFKELVEKTKLLPNLVEEEEEAKEESMEVDMDKKDGEKNEEKDNEEEKGEVQSEEKDEEKKEVMEVESGQVAVELQGIVGGLLQALSQLVHLLQSFPGLQDDSTKGVLLKDCSNDNDILFSEEDCVFLYRNIKQCKLLEGLLLLLSSPAINNHPGIFHLTNSILSRFKNSQQGLVLLASMPTITNIIVQLLTQNIECGLDESKPEHLGLSLSCHLRCMQLLDQLKQVGVVDDSGETTSTNLLFHLQSLTFLPQGKQALANIFCKPNNLSVLMIFIKNTDEQNIVEFNYVVTLLACIARYSDDVRWIMHYGAEILKALDEGGKLVRCEEQYKELKEWLAPAKLKLAPDSACINSIADLLKTLPAASYSAISAMRLLKHFTMPSSHDGVDEMNCKLLVADLHRCHCLKIFTNILKSMKDKMMLSWQLGIAQTQSDKWTSVCTVKLVLTLMRLLVSKLIRARQSQLQDLSCIQPLLTIHSIFCSSLHNGILPPDLQLIQDLCIDILLCFTRTFPESIASPMEIEKSTWSSILRELLDFVVSSPCYFLSGLVLLSELMPLPLPLQTSHTVSKEVSSEAVMSRQRWSAHLLTQASSISQLISSLSPTSYQPLAQLLRRVCWQIGDLSTPCSLLITRSILDALLDNLKTSDEQAIDTDKVQESSQSTAATLNLASFLFKQPPLKHAFLSLLVSNDEHDSKYKDLLYNLCEMLNVVSDSTPHLLGQVAIAELLNAFCDASITLLDDTSDEDMRLACSLPNASVLQHITTTIFTHLSHPEHKFSSSLVCLRTLASLFTHHYGFYFIKKCSRECSSPFYSLLMRLNASFSKDSLECMSTLSCTIDCLQRLSFVPSSESTEELLMDVKEMRRLVDWPLEGGHNHPLLDLNALLKEYAKEEPALEPVYLNVNKVYELLISDQQVVAPEETQEYKLPEALSLKDQMNGRVVFEVVSEDNEEDEDINDKLTSAYWLSTPMGDEDLEGDQVKVNLLSLANECLPTFDLQRELKKHCEQNAEQDKNNLAIKGNTETINTSKLKGANHAFVAPLRGRGFTRGSGVMSSRDVFRSRPPNTSRPPSMHVDDFVKMETHHQQPATPTLIPLGSMPAKPQEMMRSDFDRGAKIVAPNRYLSQLPQRIDDHGMLLRGGYSRMMAADRGVMRGTATGVFRRNYAIPFSVNRSDTSMSTPSMAASMMDRMTRGVANRGRGGAYHYVHNIPSYFEQKE